MTLAETARPARLGSNEGRKLRVITDLVAIMATAADTGGACFLVQAETPPAGGFPLHTQRYDDQTCVVLAGSYRFRIDDAEIDLGPGECVFIPRGTAHGYTNTSDVPARMLVFATPGGVRERFLDEIGDAAGRAPWEPDMARVLAVAPKYGIAFQASEPGGDEGGAPG